MVLNSKGEDTDHIVLGRMLVDWLHGSHKVMKLAKRNKVAPTKEQVVGLVEGTLDKAACAQLLRAMLVCAPVRKEIGNFIHKRRGGMPLATIQQELKEMSVYGKDWAKAAEAGLVVPDSTTLPPSR